MAFIVNRYGTVHSVLDINLEEYLSSGFRLATEEEIRRWYSEQGLPFEEIDHGQTKHAKSDKSGKRPYRRRSGD